MDRTETLADIKVKYNGTVNDIYSENRRIGINILGSNQSSIFQIFCQSIA